MEKNTGIAAIPDTIADDEAVVVRFVTLPTGQMDRTGVREDFSAYGYFAVEVFAADGTSLSRIQKEGATLPTSITLHYDAYPHTRMIGCNRLAIYSAYWNYAQQTWMSDVHEEDIPDSWYKILYLDRYGKYAMFFNMWYTPPPCIVDYEETFDDLTIFIPEGACDDYGLRVNVTPIERDALPDAIPPMNDPTVWQVFKYYNVQFTDGSGTLLNSMHFTPTEHVNGIRVTVEYNPDVTLQAPVTIPFTQTHLLHLGNSIRNEWQIIPAEVRDNTLSVELTDPGSTFAVLTALRQVYLPLVRQ
jgi:hypothetical protein